MSRQNVQVKPKEGNKIRLVKQNGKKKQKKNNLPLNCLGGGKNTQAKRLGETKERNKEIGLVKQNRKKNKKKNNKKKLTT